jgi:hypothetical protein
MNSNHEFERVIAYLRQWHGRRRLVEALLWLPRGLLGGLLVAVLVAAVARFRPLLTNDELAGVSLILALAGLVISLAVLLWQRYSVIQQARFADSHFVLQERVSTAVEIQTGQLTTTPTLARQQLADTVRAMGVVDVRQALPFSLNRQDMLVLLTAVILLAAAYLLPNPQQLILERQRAIDKSIVEQVQALEALAEEIRQNPALTAEQKETLLEPITGALEELQGGNLSQEGAVAVLSAAEATLRELSDANSTEALRQQLQQAGQPLANNPAAQTLGQQLQQGNLGQAGAAAAQLADNLPSLTAAEQAALAEDLAATAAALQNMDPQLAAQFAQAAQALQNGDVAAAQQALREAAATLQQRQQQQAAAQQAAAAAGQLNQGRQEVAQAGQEGQSGQSGQQGQQGQQGQGQGEGQSDGPGQGSGLGQGEGSGQGEQSGQQIGGGQSGAAPGPGGGQGPNVFAPNFVDLSDIEGVQVELPAECRVNPAQCGPLLTERPSDFNPQNSVVPYNQVFGQYRDTAYESLSGDYIPLGLKGYVRDYFSQLEP